MSNEAINPDDFIGGMESTLSDPVAMQAGARKIAALPFWSGPVEPEPLPGGASNMNFVVVDRGRKYMVRLGEDNLLTGANRTNEAHAIEAAGKAGVGPKLFFVGEGAIIAEFIEGRALKPADLRDAGMMERIAATLRRAHYEIPHHLNCKDFVFWPYHHCHWYLRQAESGQNALPEESARVIPGLRRLVAELGEVVDAVNIVFGHNDLMPQNVMDTGDRIVFVDWEYSGFSPDLFDLGNLMMNADPTENQIRAFLRYYYGASTDGTLFKRALAMMIIAAIREGAWSILMETRDQVIDFDYAAYSRMCLERIAKLEQRYREI